jgi:hypothetical protein
VTLTILLSGNRVEGARDFYWVRARWVSIAHRPFVSDHRVITIVEHAHSVELMRFYSLQHNVIAHVDDGPSKVNFAQYEDIVEDTTVWQLKRSQAL